MLEYFRRHNQKEYDGPNVPVISEVPKQQKDISYDNLSGDSKSSRSERNGSNSRRSSVKSSSTKDNPTNKSISASGISSRRRSSVKTSKSSRSSSFNDSQTSASLNSNSHITRSSVVSSNNSHLHSTAAIPQIPMEHDGGILCVTPLPSRINACSKYDGGYDGGQTHRFLTGGADGRVKLWEVFEPPIQSFDNNLPNLTPRLVRTYNGHRGYVHSIAFLGLFDPTVRRGSSMSAFGSDSDDEQSVGGASFKRLSNARSNASGSETGYSGSLKGWGRRKRELFVTASRDNTLRIWELDSNNENSAYFDCCPEDNDHSKVGKASLVDPSSKGRKLRGHVFGSNASRGGVLCVCAVPSLTPDGNITMQCERTNQTSMSNGMISAGQFVSGGSDGRLVVWDVFYSSITVSFCRQECSILRYRIF